MRDFVGKQAMPRGREPDAAAGPAPGKQALTELLPHATAPVQRKRTADAPAPAPAAANAPRPTLHDLFGGALAKRAPAQAKATRGRAEHDPVEQGPVELSGGAPLPAETREPRTRGRGSLGPLRRTCV
jgi:hypothetical protein